MDIDHAFFFAGPSDPWQSTADDLIVKGKASDAEKLAAEKQQAAIKAGDKPGEAAAGQVLAIAKLANKNSSEALKLAEQARSLCNGIGNAALASATLTLARVHLSISDWDDAFESASDALSMFKKDGSKTGEAASLNIMAVCELMRGNGDACFKNVEDSYVMFESDGSSRGKASALHTKSMLMTAAGQQAEGVRIAQEAADLLKQSGDYRYAAALLATTDSAVQSSDYHDAIESSKAALAMFEQLGDKPMQADVLMSLCNFYFRQDRFEEGIETTEKTFSLFNDLGDSKSSAQAILLAAQMKRAKLSKGSAAWPPARGIKPVDLADLETSASEAVKLFSALADDEGEASSRYELAHCYLATGDLQKGNQEVNKAMQIFASLGDVLGECISTIVAAQVQYNIGEKDFAANTIDKALGIAQDAAHEYLEKVCKQFKKQLEDEVKAREVAKAEKMTSALPEQIQGGIPASVYAECIRTIMLLGDTHGEHICDAPNQFSALEAMLGCKFTFVRNRPPPGSEFDNFACAEAWGRPPTKPVIKPKAGGKAPKAAESAVKSSLGGINRKPRLSPMAVPEPKVDRSKAVGSDILGGLMEGVPEDVHADMVALATSGDIPVSQPKERAICMTKKPSFYGDPIFRDALRFGYIHPSSAAPRGMKWKSVRAGAFKLVPL